MCNQYFNIFIIFLISILQADFFDDNQFLKNDLTWRDSIPKNMPIIKKPFWSEDGIFRKYNILEN